MLRTRLVGSDEGLLACHAAWATDGKARTREGVPADEAFRQAEFLAERPHLVLEEFAQRLDQLHVHALGQAADIVMRLDGGGGGSGEGDAFDHIWIEGTLGEEIGAAQFLRFLIEYLDEKTPDRLPLLLGILDPGQAVEEQVRGVHHLQLHPHVALERALDCLPLARAQQTRVHEDVGELITDRAMHQRGRHAGIDAAR